MGIFWPRSIYVHSQYRNIPWLRTLDPVLLVRIHPHTASKRNIEDGDGVIVSSPRGSIKVEAKLTKRVPPDIAAITWGWGEEVPGAGGNELTNDAIRDPISGTTSTRLFLCEVQRI